MEKKSTRALSIAVVFLVLVLVVCIRKIGSLEKEIDEVRNSYAAELSVLRTDMNNIYANVDAQMKRQASILASVEWDFGAPDLDSLTVPIEFCVVPKTVSEETRVSATIAGESLELERKGDSFSGSFAVPLSFRGNGFPIVTIVEGDIRSTEIVKELDVALLSTEYLPTLYVEDVSGVAELQDGSIVFNTDLLIWYDRMFEDTATFVEAAIIASVDGSQVDRIDVSDNIVDITNNGTGGEWYLRLDKSYPVPDGSELVIAVVAVDSFGFTHSRDIGGWTVSGDELAQRVQSAQETLIAPNGSSSTKEL